MSTPADIRDWARDQGHDVPVRGPLPKALRAAYDSAHGSQPEPAAPAPEPEAGAEAADVMEEAAPREIKVPNLAEKAKARAGSWRKARPGSPKPRAKPRPRVPVDGLISSMWRGLSGLCPLPATSRLLKIQAPVAGIILEDTVKGTVIDRFMQPVARLEKSGEDVYALLGPLVCVTAVQLQPDAAPFIIPVLRHSMLTWMKVAGPKMVQAMKQEALFEEEFGQTVDELIAFLFSDPSGDMQQEEERIHAAQQELATEAAA